MKRVHETDKNPTHEIEASVDKTRPGNYASHGREASTEYGNLGDPKDFGMRMSCTDA